MKLATHKKRQTLIILILAVFLLGVGLLVLEKAHITDFIKDPTYKAPPQGPTDTQKNEDKQTAATQKERYIDNSVKQQTPAQVTPVPTDNNTITLTGTQSGSVVTVHNELHGQGYSSGSCKLTITNATKSTSQTADIMYQPEYSMCAGFSVPVSSVGPGTWTIVLAVTPFGGETLSKTLSMDVQP